MKMESHINLVGWLHIAYSAFLVLIAALVFTLLGGIGLALAPEEIVATRILTSVGIVVALFIVLLAVPGMIGGAFLLQREPWARVLVLVIGCLYLPSFPFGTALGIYTILVLLNQETTQLFSSR